MRFSDHQTQIAAASEASTQLIGSFSKLHEMIEETEEVAIKHRVGHNIYNGQTYRLYSFFRT